jgi:Sulfotransferase family
MSPQPSGGSSSSTVYVFLIGTGRCGSTLVHELLARHPDVGFISNLEDRLPALPSGARRSASALYRHASVWARGTTWLRYAPSEAYRALAREVSPMVTEPSRDLLADDAMPWLAERFRSFFTTRARMQGKPVFLHKFTGWPRTGFVGAVLPEARFINVVRDGRAVVASGLQAPWWRGHQGPERWPWGPLPPAYAAEWEASGRSFVVLAGLGWKMLMDAYATARDLVPAGQWLDVRFEDVLARPRSCFEEMLDLMGLDEDKTFTRALSRTRFTVDRRDAFRRELGPAAVELLERSLADHLRLWGYS